MSFTFSHLLAASRSSHFPSGSTISPHQSFNMTTPVPFYANLSNDIEIEYLCNIRQDKAHNIHYLEDKKVLVLRNHQEGSGNLVDLKQSKASLIEREPWILLTLKEFNVDDVTESVPVCHSCSKDVLDINKSQTKEKISSLICLHSKICGHIVRNFANPFFLDTWLTLNEEEDEEIMNVHILLEKKDRTTKSQSLAVVKYKKRVSLLYTVGKMTTPACTFCSSACCQCVRLWRKKVKVSQPVPEPSEDQEATTDDKEEPAHFNDGKFIDGFNRTKIEFPLKRNAQQKAMLDLRGDPAYTLPEALIPMSSGTCPHGNEWSDSLKLAAPSTVVYHEGGERKYNTKVYYRETSGTCKCQDHVDGHPYLLYNMGRGQFVDYVTLQSFVIKVATNGECAYGFHKSIKTSCQANGVEFNCSYETMLKACDGFTRLLDFDLEACFSCPNCGTSPEYFVGDGKADIAPLQTKLQGIGVKELSAHPEDKIPLEQGSLHKERVFIPEKKERDIFCELVTDGVTLKDFLKDRNVKQLKSENSKLLVKIIKKHSDLQSLPDCYKSLITELVKNSPVAGLIQTTSKRALVLLKQFLKRKLDLLDGSHQSELKFLRSELLGFLPLLLEICDFEKQNFLPGLISEVTLTLLNIRKKTFRGGPIRYASDYTEFSGKFESNTQFYPQHKLLRYPKHYNVGNNVDQDYCEKHFSSARKFADGIFTIGCCCKYNITYGWELALTHESSRHFFRFLTCRQVNFKKLKGIFYDFSCGLHRYVLNREPMQFEYIRFMVDGSHWTSKKKFKKADQKSKGHVGCSSSYNGNLVKEHRTAPLNTQGREQMHSVLDKLGKSLRQKNYRNFCAYLTAFFAIRNLLSINGI